MERNTAMPGYDVSAHSTAPPDTIYTLLITPATWPAWSPIDAGARGRWRRVDALTLDLVEG